MRRFTVLTGLLVALLAGGELLGRRSERLMMAVAHRVNFKLALLEQRGAADFVVLGTSRGNDCVAPGPIGRNGASVATPSSSLETLELLASKTAATPGLKLAFIELSRRQMEAAEPDDAEGPEQVDDAAADPLGAWLSRHSALLRGRRAFALENWSRLPALVFPSRFDGSEFLHTKWLSEALVSVGPPAPGELERFTAAHELPVPQSGPEWERVSQSYRRVADVFRAQGVKVLLYGPPLSGRRRRDECDPESRRFRASVAAFADVPYEDFACVEVPDGWITDADEHCGALGRSRFSARLGALARKRGYAVP